MTASTAITRKVAKTVELARALKPSRQTGHSFHVTTIWDKSRLAAVGHNDYTRSHPARRVGRVYRDTRSHQTRDYRPCLHSEVSAIIRLGVEDLSRYTVVNARVLNDGSVGMARPCPNCLELLRQMGSRRLVWTCENGEVEVAA